MARWEQVLDDLVHERGSALVGYGYLLTGDRREAEDLVQDALVKTFTRGKGTTEVHNAEGYVRRAMLTTYLDGFRRRRRWAAVRHLAVADESHSGHEHAVEARVDVRDALSALRPRERACVVLRFYEDMTVPAVADALGLSAGAVKRYLSDAVRTLEGRLGAVDADEPPGTTRDTPSPDAPPLGGQPPGAQPPDAPRPHALKNHGRR